MKTLENCIWSPFRGCLLGVMALGLLACQDSGETSPSTVVGPADPSSIISIEEEREPLPELREESSTPSEDVTDAPEEEQDTWSEEDAVEGEEGELRRKMPPNRRRRGRQREAEKIRPIRKKRKTPLNLRRKRTLWSRNLSRNPTTRRVTLHRLNRTEYNNTVQALFGTEQTPAENFPADDQGYGFDNIADVLSISPLHFELYELAARGLIDEACIFPWWSRHLLLRG